jgi:CheY-like chemotaxis protein
VTSQSPPTPDRPQALIVDDAMLIQRYVADILETVGVSSTFAEDGAAALLMTRNQHIDVILLDLAMPIMDGWEFLRELRANPATAAIPVLVITAHGQSGTATEAAELGAQGYLEKPFRRDQLLTLVAPYLETGEDQATA